MAYPWLLFKSWYALNNAGKIKKGRRHRITVPSTIVSDFFMSEQPVVTLRVNFGT
jgi:hypothetical protein